MTASLGIGWIMAGLAAAAGLSSGLILLLKPLLQRYALARPNARSSHTIPTPQGGGIAVIGAALVVTGAVLAAAGVAWPSWLLLLAGAAGALAVLGAVDDIRPLPVAPRFGLQLLVIGLFIFGLPADWRIVPALPAPVERTLLLAAAVWFVNLTNFMDGLDWMTVAETLPVTAALAVLGYAAGLAPAAAVVLAAALFGAMLGFAPFNKPVARLFLGDVGSLPLGLMLFALLLIIAASGAVAAAVLLPLYYLADATLTLIRRMIAGERFWQAHRSHYYQRATSNGFTVRQVVGRVFAVNLALALLAFASVAVPSWPIWIGTLALGGLLVGLLLRSFARPR